MPAFWIEYDETTVTRQRILITAESEKEAVEAVEGYDFDNSLSEEQDQMSCTYSNVTSEGEDE